jgi:hypothetical protein
MQESPAWTESLSRSRVTGVFDFAWQGVQSGDPEVEPGSAAEKPSRAMKKLVPKTRVAGARRRALLARDRPEANFWPCSRRGLRIREFES